jgi:hypothetical protein
MHRQRASWIPDVQQEIIPLFAFGILLFRLPRRPSTLL